MKTFKHSGDLGDIIFGLPAMKAKGGGILYLDPTGGEGQFEGLAIGSSGKTKLTKETILAAKEFLEAQPYIDEVKLWEGEKVNYNLDEFRKHISFNNLTKSHLEAFSIPHDKADVKWLKLPSMDTVLPEGKSFVVARNVRYQGNHAFWEQNAEMFKEKAVFVGSPFEHEVWEHIFGEGLEYLSTPTIMHLAQAINECKTFVGNQGLPHAIAEGFKKPMICEVDKTYPAAVFKREDAKYV
jgi:hypothetical protein